MPFDAAESMMLGFHDDPVYGRLLFDRGKIIKEADRRMEAFDVRPRDPLLKTANFSGGNQQKLVLAREIDREPRVMLVGQPTRGVDIGAIEFIHRRLVAERDAGRALFLVPVELDEITVRSHHRFVRRPCDGRAQTRRDQPAGPRLVDGGRGGARGMSVWALIASPSLGLALAMTTLDVGGAHQ
jgi:simple sugar transport system ATP-binding protein